MEAYRAHEDFHASSQGRMPGLPLRAKTTEQPQPSDLYSDPQLRHRGHFIDIAHPLHGMTTSEGARFKLSRTPAHIERTAPTLGCDNRHVLETILGYNPARIAEFEAQGILQ